MAMTVRERVRSIEEAAEIVGKISGRSRTYALSEIGRHLSDGSAGAAPRAITLLGAGSRDSDRDQLFVDQHPIPRANWTWQDSDRILRWQYGTGPHRLDGYLEFDPTMTMCFGTTTCGTATGSVEGQLGPVSYTCAVSADAGAFYNTARHALDWPEPDSEKWAKATWVKDALRFTYDIIGKPIVGHKIYDIVVGFDDLQTDTRWDPDAGDYTALVTADLQMTMAVEGISPPDDDRSGLPSPGDGVKTVLPYRVAFTFDGFGAQIEGAMLTGRDSALGAVYAMSGRVDNHAIVGLYRITGIGGRTCVVGVSTGSLHVNDEPVATVTRSGDTITWTGLAPAAAAATGLPPSGELRLSPDGETVLGGTGVTGGARVSYEELAADPAALQAQQATAGRAASLSAGLGVALDPTTLYAMTQYRKDDKGDWLDAVQRAALPDFYLILQALMDENLRKTYLSLDPVNLNRELQAIAELRGADGADPKAWYETLSIAYLTNALSTVADPFAAKLNARRAQSWLTKKVAQSSVYQAQAPALYSRHWSKIGTNTGIGDYLKDQIAKSAEHSAEIEADRLDWRAQMEAEIVDAPETLKAMLATIDAAAAQGKRQQYWAYVLFRYATQPGALKVLQAISIGPSALDGTAYSRKIQQTCATLNMLDKSGTFVRLYTQVIQTFQLANVLPQLIDYSGNIDEYQFAVEKILKAFIDKYGKSTDPDIAKQVADYKQALQDHWVREILNTFANLASVLHGVYSWEQIAQRLEKTWPTTSKITLRAAQLVTLAAVSAGIAAFVFGSLNWNELDETEQTALITGGLEVFFQLGSALVKRGVAYTAVLKTNGCTWANFWKAFTGDAMRLAERRMAGGVSKWMITRGMVPVTDEVLRMLGVFEEPAEQTLMTKIFGKNLDEFVATRLGAVFAIINIVLSAIALTHSESEEETAANALFLTSACLELIATAGAWAMAGFGVEAIGGLAIATLATVITVVAAFAAIAGLVIMLILLFKDRPKSSVELFAEGPAAQAGYFMPLGAEIESFQVVPPSGDEPQLVGVALLSGNKALTMAAGGTVSVAEPTHDASMSFYLATDETGRARISAGLPAKPGEKLLSSYVLTADNGQVKALAPRSDQKGQFWTATLRSVTRWDSASGQPVQGEFYFSVIDGGKTSYLHADGATVTLEDTPSPWLLTMVKVAPSYLTMENLDLFDYQTDGQYSAYLGQPGSAPREWTVTPGLPAFLTIDKDSGIIAWKTPGERPKPMPQAVYRLKVENKVGSVTAEFKIQVQHVDPLDSVG